MLQMRNVMITTVGEDYVVAAQAKGLSSCRVVRGRRPSGRRPR